MLPMAPFNKFAGPSSTLQPWEDGVVRLDGADARQGSSVIEETGLVDACKVLSAHPELVGVEIDSIFRLHVEGSCSKAGGAEQVGASDELRSKLAQAEAEVQRWQENYMELYEKALSIQAKADSLM
jgi:hypothetical protein